jgi:hypothetical protein
MGTTKFLVAGNYNIKPSIYSSSFSSGPLAMAMQMPIAITDGGTATFPPITFAISKTGGFKFTIQALTNGPNCMTPGAGITGMSIQLSDSGGACVPLPTIGTACPATTGACVENTMQLMESNLPAGSYTLVIHGFQGAEDCYDASVPVQINGGGQVTDLHEITPVIDMTKVMAGTCTAP